MQYIKILKHYKEAKAVLFIAYFTVTRHSRLRKLKNCAVKLLLAHGSFFLHSNCLDLVLMPFRMTESLFYLKKKIKYLINITILRLRVTIQRMIYVLYQTGTVTVTT